MRHPPDDRLVEAKLSPRTRTYKTELESKEAYLAHLEQAPDEVLRVSLADKLHNARAILSDYREVGEELWSRFNGTREESLWYYRSLVEIFARRYSGPLAEELETTVSEIEALAGG